MFRRAAPWLALALFGAALMLAQNPYPPVNSPVFRALDQNGKPLAGGRLYTYAAGSTTPQATYASADSSAPNTNPVVLDSAGRAKIFMAPLSYKFVLTDMNGVQQWTVDNISGAPPLAAINTVFGRTGNVVAVAGDYSCGQITGAVCALPSLYYQQIEAGGQTFTARGNLNLIGGTSMAVTCADNAGNNSTDCTVAYAQATGTNRTCNTNGCYRIMPDGTIESWGVVTLPSNSGATLTTGVLTFPTTFTTLPALTLTGAAQASGYDDAYVVFHKNISITGATVVLRCTVNISGSGCPNIANSVPVHWHALGY